jgi:hypothetical protein
MRLLRTTKLSLVEDGKQSGFSFSASALGLRSGLPKDSWWPAAQTKAPCLTKLTGYPRPRYFNLGAIPTSSGSFGGWRAANGECRQGYSN